MAAHTHDLSAARHEHHFVDAARGARERAIAWVTLLTLATMVLELAVGYLSDSLALTADGWHMGTHALALGGAWLAYRLAAGRTVHCAFGGWKIEVLAAYTSALALAAVAIWLLADAGARLLAPPRVDFMTALAVAVVGLVVNVASAVVLARGASTDAGAHGPERGPQHRHDDGHGQGGAHRHAGGHGHAHGDDRHHGHQDGHHHDHNFAAAYLHVLADALTSVLAIVALAGGAWFGWLWLDPAVAALGAVVIAHWSYRMLRSSAGALVDGSAHQHELARRIRAAIQTDGDAAVADLHVWQVGGRAWSAALAVVADAPASVAQYRERLAGVAELAHVTIEVHRCPGCQSAVPRAEPARG
jgi:cation diffusion facilitator family transporter